MTQDEATSEISKGTATVLSVDAYGNPVQVLINNTIVQVDQ